MLFSSYFLALLKNLYKKRACITLMKLMAGADFTNILCAAFTPADPKSAKKYIQTSYFCAFGILISIRMKCW